MNLTNLYTIVKKEHSEDAIVSIKVRLNKDHQLFEGHFPEHHVLPGVVMLQMIKTFTENECNSALFMFSASDIKFLSIVNPDLNDLLVFKLQLQKENDTLKVKNSTTFTNGTIVMKSTTVYSTKH